MYNYTLLNPVRYPSPSLPDRQTNQRPVKLSFLTQWLGRWLAVGQVVGGSGPAPSQATEALHVLLNLLPELLLATVLHCETGQLLATYAVATEWQPATLATPLVAALHALRASLPSFGEAGANLREVMLMVGPQLHLLWLEPGGQRGIYLAIAAYDTNLALARQALQKSLAKL